MDPTGHLARLLVMVQSLVAQLGYLMFVVTAMGIQLVWDPQDLNPQQSDNLSRLWVGRMMVEERSVVAVVEDSCDMMDI